MSRCRRALGWPAVGHVAVLLALGAGCSRTANRAGKPTSAPTVVIDRANRTVTITASIARQGTYEVLKGAIEYALVSRGGKDYETVFIADCQPADLFDALRAVDFVPGRPAAPGVQARGRPLEVLAEYRVEGKTVRRPIDEFIVHLRDNKPLAAKPWTFTGSLKTSDPQTNREVLQASLTRNLIGLHPADPSPLLQNPRPEAERGNIYGANVDELPPPGTPVRMVFRPLAPPPGHARVRATAAGRVQYVGFAEFIERRARQLRLNGLVRHPGDGRIELVAEGPEQDLARLVEYFRQGPRNARIDSVEVAEEPAEVEFDCFEALY